MIQQEGWGWKTERSEVTDWIYISDKLKKFQPFLNAVIT